jgi:DNA-binding SARP family transcriptional activator
VFFRMLGPVDVWAQERSHDVGPWKQQCILAVLLVESGRTVSAQTLAERVWDEQMPGQARETLQVYVSRLRGRLRSAGDDSGVITSSGGGYRMKLAPERVDVRRFYQLINNARAASAARDPRSARDLLVQAEQLWRGEPLEGLTGQWAESTRQALHERRRGALLARIGIDLQLESDLGEAISELTALSRAGRIDQSAIEMLMDALARSGRQQEALETYRSARVRLREELGVDPRPELKALHQRVLRGEPLAARADVEPARRGALAPDTLDRDPPYLIGRDENVHDLLAGVAEDLDEGSGIALFAIDGMPGIGKTAVALRAAHQLALQCPDGALQINFRTHDPRQPPLDPRTALVLLLGALGAPSEELGRAGSVDELAGLWRRRTRGLRLLVLFDDVLDADQVAPLIPVAAGSVILVTSRRRLLHLPGARHITIEALSDIAAIRLLTRVTGRRFPNQARDLQRFAARCGGLPLAVAVAAAYLRAHPAWSLADLADRLASSTPAAGDDGLSAPVHRAFELSYRALPQPQRRLLRLVAAQPVSDISLDAVTALLDDASGTVDLMLEALVEHHLLEEVSRHRYRLHDLLRAFAGHQAADEDEEAETAAAIGRMITFYLAAAAQAERTVRPHRRIAGRIPTHPLVAGLGIDEPESARRWLEVESENLLAIADSTDTGAPNEHAGVMACIAAPQLDRRGLWPQAVMVLTRALRAVAADGYRDPSDPSLAQLHIHLSAAYMRRHRFEEAAECATAAHAAWQSQLDRRGQADALLELGRIHWYTGRLDQALEVLERSEALYRDIHQPHGRVLVDYHRAIILFQQGRHADALGMAQRALAMVGLVGDAALECDVLVNLGEMHRWTGQDELARNCFLRARQLADQQRDPQIAAALALNFGILQHRAGQQEAASESLQAALALFGSLEDRGYEIETLEALAAVHRVRGAVQEATKCIGEAERLLAQADDPQRRSRIEAETAEVLLLEQHEAAACTHLRAAVELARAASAPLEEADARRALGNVLMGLDDADAAREQWELAMTLYRRLGHVGATRPDADQFERAYLPERSGSD